MPEAEASAKDSKLFWHMISMAWLQTTVKTKNIEADQATDFRI